jgi:hypothetical protein
MRTLLLSLLAIPLFTVPAAAGRTGGAKGGGGGALSRVSSGLGRATPSVGSTTTRSADNDHRVRETVEESSCHDLEGRRVRCGALTTGVGVGRAAPVVPSRKSKVGFYAGAQKVHDSEGSVSLAVTVTDRRFRVVGGVSQYFETLPGGDRLKMTMPTFLAGVRIDDLGRTLVVLEGGVVHVGTDGDPMEESSITGPIVGMSIEHQVSKQVSVTADVHSMWFDDKISARAGRLGVRLGHLQASFRVLDFNVGPALFGPEVGVRF